MSPCKCGAAFRVLETDEYGADYLCLNCGQREPKHATPADVLDRLRREVGTGKRRANRGGILL